VESSRRPATVIVTKAARMPLFASDGWEGTASRMNVSQETLAKPEAQLILRGKKGGKEGVQHFSFLPWTGRAFLNIKGRAGCAGKASLR